MILITGIRGTLGRALHAIYPYAVSTLASNVTLAYLCGGTKGFNECDGNDAIFRRDVDGNIALIRALLRINAFVVFISTEAVERIGHRAAYSSNRLMVEQFLWTKDNCAIIRPKRFDKETAPLLAQYAQTIGENKMTGIHRWL